MAERPEDGPKRRAGGDKPAATLVVTNIRACLTMAAGEPGPLAGERQEATGTLKDAAIAAAGDKLVYVGPASGLPAAVRVAPDAVRVDAAGGIALPGFVDCHTHVVFAGWRAGEFAQRVAGSSYQQILEAGGGILRTVAATRAAGEEDLVDATRARLERMLVSGTTTIEAKSGYGLTLADEAKILRVIRRLDGTGPWELVPTLLGAHALPAEYRDDRDGYIDLVLEMIETLADRAAFIDAFCEIGAFTGRECRKVLERGRRAGLGIKLHADQLSDCGGALLAAELHAVSADHLDFVTPEATTALAAAGTIAVMLPTVPLYVMARRQAPAARLQAAGVPLALASDFNPGTSPVESMGVVVALACLLMRMSPEAALVAATRNAAWAAGRGDRVGSLEAGKQADLQVYAIGEPAELPYRFGQLAPSVVVKKGHIVAAAGELLAGR
jgi:imidazolonepropionase